jgi:hypothetical protein
MVKKLESSQYKLSRMGSKHTGKGEIHNEKQTQK